MGESIRITAADGHTFDAWRSSGGETPKGALVVVQEIFGVNGHIRDVCDRFAADGYTCISPALFDRARRGVDIGYTQETVEEGLALRAEVGLDGPVADVAASIQTLRDEGFGKVGVVGYCWGGSLSFIAACRSGADAAVGYYGGQIIEFVDETPKAPTILHFGAEDSGIPAADLQAISQKHPNIPVHVYEGAGHGFSCDQRADFNPEATKLARTRTLAHFAEHLA